MINLDEKKLYELLTERSKEELINIILEYVEKSEEYEKDLLGKFGKLDEIEELERIKEKIKQVLQNNNYRRFIGYIESENICSEFSDLSALSEKRREQGYYWLSVQIFLEMIKELMSMSNNGFEMLVYVFQDCIKYLRNSIEVFEEREKPDKKEEILDLILKISERKAFNGWIENRYDLLECAVPLLTKDNYKKLLETSKLLRETESKYEREAAYKEDKILSLKVILKIEGLESGKEFSEQYLEVEEIREWRVKTAIDEEDYKLAGKLCQEMIHNIEVYSYQRMKKWLFLSLEIYELSQDIKNKIEVLKKIVLGGNLEYYETLKGLLKERGDWESEYQILLNKFKKETFNNNYSRILKKEKEWEKLLKCVQNNANLIRDYGEDLVIDYPEETGEIYANLIINNAGETKGRKEYRLVCEDVLKLSKLGQDAKAKELILKLREEYCRRPSFLDELNKISEKL